jgi:hypothetical protein
MFEHFIESFEIIDWLKILEIKVLGLERIRAVFYW